MKDSRFKVDEEHRTNDNGAWVKFLQINLGECYFKPLLLDKLLKTGIFSVNSLTENIIDFIKQSKI